MARSIHSVTLSFVSSLLLWSASVTATLGLYDANDLQRFVSRPDLMPPKWNVTKYDSNKLSPGYWFVTPSSDLPENHQDDGTWTPCQQGPAIYDEDGELIWSGACLLQNRKTYNFDLTQYQGKPVLQGMVKHADWLEIDAEYGVYINDKYEVEHNFLITPFGDETHKSLEELNAKPARGGRSIVSATRPIKVSAADLPGLANGTDIWIKGDGFVEVDRRSGQTTEIMWWAEEHVSLNESTFAPAFSGKAVDFTFFANETYRWDPYHITSIDKNSEGDYLVSLAHTDTIYLVSRADGSIKWRFGGLKNDFIMEDGLNFSRQHDARFVSHSPNKTVVSFLDNTRGHPDIDLGSPSPSSNSSRGLLVELSHPTTNELSSSSSSSSSSEYRAKILQEFNRPNGGVTVDRGNMQILPNGNVLMGWGDNGHITEHSPTGEVLMEARFVSQTAEKTRFNTHRTYKHEGWIGNPTEPPVIKAFAYASKTRSGSNALPKIGGEDIAPGVMVVYASWNGGTEHKKWRFHDGETLEHLGDADKKGFETTFVTRKLVRSVYAIAADGEGRILSSSMTVESEWTEWIWDVPEGIVSVMGMHGWNDKSADGQQEDEEGNGEKSADGSMNSAHGPSVEEEEEKGAWHFLLAAIGACPWLFTLLILPAPLGWVVLITVLFRKPATVAEIRELLLSPMALWRSWRNGWESDSGDRVVGSKGRGRYETIPLTAT